MLLEFFSSSIIWQVKLEYSFQKALKYRFLILFIRKVLLLHGQSKMLGDSLLSENDSW